MASKLLNTAHGFVTGKGDATCENTAFNDCDISCSLVQRRPSLHGLCLTCPLSNRTKRRCQQCRYYRLLTRLITGSKPHSPTTTSASNSPGDTNDGCSGTSSPTKTHGPHQTGECPHGRAPGAGGPSFNAKSDRRRAQQNRLSHDRLVKLEKQAEEQRRIRAATATVAASASGAKEQASLPPRVADSRENLPDGTRPPKGKVTETGKAASATTPGKRVDDGKCDDEGDAKSENGSECGTLSGIEAGQLKCGDGADGKSKIPGDKSAPAATNSPGSTSACAPQPYDSKILVPDAQKADAHPSPTKTGSTKEGTPSGAPDKKDPQTPPTTPKPPPPATKCTGAGCGDTQLEEKQLPSTTTDVTNGHRSNNAPSPAAGSAQEKAHELMIKDTGVILPGRVTGQSESVIVRLTNRIRVLEQNLSLSSQYLTELSRNYKRQMEDLVRGHNRTASILNLTTSKLDEQITLRVSDTVALKDQVKSLEELVQILKSQQQYFQDEWWRWIFAMVTVEATVLCLGFWLICGRRTPPSTSSITEQDVESIVQELLTQHIRHDSSSKFRDKSGHVGCSFGSELMLNNGDVRVSSVDGYCGASMSVAGHPEDNVGHCASDECAHMCIGDGAKSITGNSNTEERKRAVRGPVNKTGVGKRSKKEDSVVRALCATESGHGRHGNKIVDTNTSSPCRGNQTETSDCHTGSVSGSHSSSLSQNNSSCTASKGPVVTVKIDAGHRWSNKDRDGRTEGQDCGDSSRYSRAETLKRQPHQHATEHNPPISTSNKRPGKKRHGTASRSSIPPVEQIADANHHTKPKALSNTIRDQQRELVSTDNRVESAGDYGVSLEPYGVANNACHLHGHHDSVCDNQHQLNAALDQNDTERVLCQGARSGACVKGSIPKDYLGNRRSLTSKSIYDNQQLHSSGDRPCDDQQQHQQQQQQQQRVSCQQRMLADRKPDSIESGLESESSSASSDCLSSPFDLSGSRTDRTDALGQTKDTKGGRVYRITLGCGSIPISSPGTLDGSDERLEAERTSWSAPSSLKESAPTDVLMAMGADREGCREEE